MAQGEGRVIKPPFEQVMSGRVFHPDNAFLYKKWLRVFIILLFIWGAIWVVFFSHPIITLGVLTLAEFTEIIILLGWTTVTQYYWIAAGTVFVLWIVYTYIYVKRVDYSLASWEGEVSPEIYVKKGIIQITQRHVPFRTVTNLRTRRGIFDRLFGIGTVQIETATKSSIAHGGGIIAIILQKLMRGGTSAENIEGVKFHEELRNFILRELRGFGRTPFPIEISGKKSGGLRILNRSTLQAFIEIRDALRELKG
ncbi:MAG: PH domain-containing protein [Candidatus Thorarchaeota archaeon]